MNPPTVLLVAVALGADAFSLSLAIGMGKLEKKQLVIVPVLIGVFHVIMPLVGFYLGNVFSRVVGTYAVWFGALVLIFIGVQMARQGLSADTELAPLSQARSLFMDKPSSRGLPLGIAELLLFALSVSIDAFNVGFGLGTLEQGVFFIIFTVGIVAALMTFAGLYFGERLGKRFGKKAELAGGLILIGIGIRMIFLV